MREPVGLTVERTAHGPWQVLVLTGELDLHTGAALARQLTSTELRNRLALDLSGVDFIDSSGLGTIVGALQRSRAAGGTLAVIAPSGSRMERMLALAGLSDRIRPLTDRSEL
jgi:anti-anti-sigma factor